jgi:transposase
VYGVSCAQVFRWFARFQEGRELLEDDPRPGWPVSARSNKNVEKAHAVVMQDRQVTTRLLAERL